MSNVACCYITRNHPETVKDVLTYCINDYVNNDIDIYYFDSSDNDDTKCIIKEFVCKGYNNIYYQKLDSNLTFDEKLLYVFSKYDFKKDYKYIWPVKDRVCAVGNLLSEISKTAEMDYSSIFLGIASNPMYPEYIKEDLQIYTDMSMFYMNWGSMANSLDLTLFNTTILSNVTFENFTSEMKWNSNHAFTHYTLLFYMLSLIENPKVAVIGSRYFEEGYKQSQRSTSLWMKDRFEIWIRKWHDANIYLPSCYDNYKEYVIKSCTAQEHLIGGQKDLIRYYKEGIFDVDVFNSISDIWNESCDVPQNDAEWIAKGKWNNLIPIVFRRITDEVSVGRIDLAIKEYYTNTWILDNDQYKSEYIELGECLKLLGTVKE